MERRRSVFNRNLISNKLQEDEIEKLKAQYKHYHKQYTCYK